MFTRLGTGGINPLADSGVTKYSSFGIETSINSFCGTQINNEHSVVFRAERSNGKREIRAQGAGPLTGVHRLIAEEGSEFSALGCNPSIAHDGSVAFVATRAGHRAIFKRDKNGQLTQMVSDSQFASFDDVALNQFGGLAFSATQGGGNRGLFRLKDGFLTTVATTSTQGTPAGFSINESGQVAFELTRGANGSSIHLGPNSVFQRLVGTGSLLFNRVVLGARISRGGLNSNGQVVVAIDFFGPVMIARGDPVRFPDFVIGTGGLVLSSALGGNVTAETSAPAPPKGALLKFDLTFLSPGARLDVKVGRSVVLQQGDGCAPDRFRADHSRRAAIRSERQARCERADLCSDVPRFQAAGCGCAVALEVRRVGPAVTRR